MPALTPADRVHILDRDRGAHGDHAYVADYCRSCDEFYPWCCGRAAHVGHRVYRRTDGTLDLTRLALDTRGTP